MAHQQKAFDDLVATAKVCFSINRRSMPVRLKTATLIVASSGLGTTHLCAEVAADQGVPYLHTSIGDWILMGSSARGGAVTMTRICSFLRSCRHRDGAVILIDEIDKLEGGRGSGSGSAPGNSWSTWSGFLKMEVFQLLDLRLPSNLVDEDSDSVSPGGIAEATEVLRNKTLILGAGAFQDLWDNRVRPSMGFLPSTSAAEDPPDPAELATRLAPELVSRFRSRIVVLPPLKVQDYHQMIDQIAPRVPPALRNTFIRLGRQGADDACRLGQGPRFLEELMLDTILAERAALVNCKIEAPESQQEIDCF